MGRLNYEQSPQGYVITGAYDGLDRLTQINYPDGTTTANTYYLLDLDTTTDRIGNTISYNYDEIRQLIGEFAPNGAQTTLTWCTCGGMGSLRDPNGNVTSWQRDLEGRATGKTYPDGSSLSYTYENTTSRMVSSTDSNQTVTAYTYNDDNTLKQMAFTPGTGVAATPTQTYTYDPVYPRILTSTDGLGMSTLTYNPVIGGTTLGQGRLAATVFAPTGGAYKLNPSLQFTYDQLGRVLTTNIGTSGANASSINNYDDLGRITSLTNSLGSFTFGYYSNTGRLNNVAMPNGVTTTLSYLDQGNTTQDPRLGDITNSNSNGVVSKFDYQYDSQGRITQWTQQADANTPTNWNYGYDPIGQLTSAVHSGISNPLQYSYTYDLAGNRTSQQVVSAASTSITNCAYDHANKLGAQSPGGSMLWKGVGGTPLYSVTLNKQPAAIDKTGTNFIANLPVTAGNNSVQIVAEDQHGDFSTNNYVVSNVSGSSASTPTYDANGNTKTDASDNTYSYDAKNEVVQITYSAGGNSKFTYDGSGRRVMIVDTTSSGTVTTKQFIFSGMAIAEEYDGTNTTQPAKRFYGQGFIQYSGANNSTATAYYYTRDHLGSIRELTDSNGNVITRLDYDPYGVTSIVSGTVIPDFAYAGMYWHQASGLYQTMFRLYNPSLGRWLSRDPIAESGGINLYDFCGNDPVNRFDFSGLLASNPNTTPFNCYPVAIQNAIQTATGSSTPPDITNIENEAGQALYGSAYSPGYYSNNGSLFDDAKSFQNATASVLNQNNISTSIIPGLPSDDFASQLAKSGAPVVILVGVPGGGSHDHAVVVQFKPCPNHPGDIKNGTFTVSNLWGHGGTEQLTYQEMSQGYASFNNGALVTIEASFGGVAATGRK